MSCEARHSKQSIENGLHSVISFEYADAAARVAAGPFDAADKYKLAWQIDTEEIYILLDETVPIWAPLSSVGGSSGGDLDLDGYDIINVNLVDGVDISSHADRHEFGGADQIDGYELELTYSPMYYAAPTNDKLGEHISNIDEALFGLSGGSVPNTRTLTAGSGLTGGGDLSADRTFNVVANIDGSIIVNTNDIQVGVLANDTQHGNLGGGSLHELADSTQNGFFSIDGYNKLEGIEDGAQVNTVDSVFGRTGVVIALSGDYDSDQIDNASTVPGLSVSDALEYFDGYVNDGVVGGDLSGTLPNPTVTDLTITGEQQGSVLYYNGTNWVQLPPGTDGYVLTTNGIGANPEWEDFNSIGAGDVDGPSSATDNAVARFDGTTGKLIQNSLVTIDDSGNISTSGTVDGVDVSDHSARHDPGGVDALTTAAAVGLNAGSTNTEGAATSFARSNHTHALDVTTGTLSTINAGDTASDGTAIGLVRRDHQHAVATATASGLTANSTSTEGTSTSLARADHTHAIDSTGTLSTINAGDTSSDGTATGFSRKDHQHPVATGSASTLSGSNAEGSSTNLARADHNHALGGSVGGDLSGTLPNPTVTDLTIAGEQQGSILYFDGYGWEELSPGDDGYVLTTNGVNANPTWEEAAVVVKRIVTVEFTLTEDVNNTTQWFTTWRSHGGDSPENKRSGTTVGIQNSNSCSPYQVPFNATIIKAVLTLKGAGVQNGSVTYPVIYQTDLFEEEFTTETKIADIDFSISNAFTVGTYSVGNTNYKGSVNLNIDVDEADLLALKFINGNGASVVGQTKNAFITLIIEER
jgi:hypothetical protein